MPTISILYSHTNSNSTSLYVHADETGVHFVADPWTSNDKPLLVTLTEEQACNFADSLNHYLLKKRVNPKV